jgi:hypothetical protein
MTALIFSRMKEALTSASAKSILYAGAKPRLTTGIDYP